MKTVQIKDITVGGGKGLFVLAGPCVIEDYDRTLAIGKRAKEITTINHREYAEVHLDTPATAL